MEVKNVKRGIQRRIIISMLIIGIIPLVAGLYLTYLDGTNAVRNSIGANFQEMAKETANKVDMVIKNEIIGVQRLAISSDIRNAIKNKKYNNSELIRFLKRFKTFDEREVYSLIVADSEGNYVGGIKEENGKGYSNERWFTDAINKGKGKVYVGDLRFDEASGMHLMSIAAPVMDYKRVIGVVVIKYSVDKLLEVVNSVRIERTGHATLVDSKGSILMCPIFPPRSHNAERPLIRLISSSKPGWDVAEDDAHGGKDSIIGFAPVESTLDKGNNWFDGNRWYVFIRQSPSEMYAPIYSLLLRVSAFGSVLIALLSLTGIYAAKNIVRPINELCKGVELLGQGDLDYRLNIKTKDEIEKLADEFNKMAGELQRTYTALEERNKELETSEARYRDLIENSPEMIHSVDAERYFVNVNKTELNILGYTLYEMQNKKIEDVVSEEYKERAVKHIERAIKEGISTIEAQFISKSGKRIDVEITATAQYHPLSNYFVKTRAFVRDITDRKKLERQLKEYYDTLEQKVNDRTKELKETKEYLENLLETANDVIYTLNDEGIITYVNKKVEEWGYKKGELIGKSFLTILSKRHQGERFKKTVIGGVRQTYEVEVIDKLGEIRYAALSVSPLRSNEGKIVEVLGIAKDITSQKRLEQQVIQAEKMSAIGQLAAGIAHEINNPLGGILNCLYNLRKKRLSPEREDEYIKSMEDGIHRVQRTVDQLLDFSLQHEPELTSVNVNSLIEDVLSLIGYAITKNGIKLKKELNPDLPQLMVDQHKMSQVMMNILLNAVQAMKGKGQIRVKTFQEDGWCCIEVMDNGEGIPPNVFPKIFDPFFTTKDVGKGTGLGLAVSRGIVEKHSGRIDVKSELGKGTTFTVKLPVNN
ncbi:MAG: PAS domain S-box protein [Nitrospirae bacterium]|nr:PAS domain S-box protein [Nitrospirota bacterium]